MSTEQEPDHRNEYAESEGGRQDPAKQGGVPHAQPDRHMEEPYKEHLSSTAGPYPLGDTPIPDVDDVLPEEVAKTEADEAKKNKHRDLHHTYQDSGRYEFEDDVWMDWNQYGLNENGQNDMTDPDQYEVQLRFWSASNDETLLDDVFDTITESIINEYAQQNKPSATYQ